MEKISRRSFLKRTAALTGAFIVGPTVAIESLANIKLAVDPKNAPFVELFKAEVTKINRRIGKSIRKMEMIKNPADFGDLLRGVVKINPNHAKYFAVSVDDYNRLMSDLNFMRAFAKEFVTTMKPHFSFSLWFKNK